MSPSQDSFKGGPFLHTWVLVSGGGVKCLMGIYPVLVIEGYLSYQFETL